MVRKPLPLLICCLFFLIQLTGVGYAKGAFVAKTFKKYTITDTDTIPPADVMEVIRTVIYATNDFNGQAVANLYTPNAVVTDDEPPYSWNGPTAGIQWVNSVEKACKNFRITKFKGTIAPVNVFQLSAENIYIVVPVSFTGNLPGKSYFTVKGAFAFVLRQINDRWLIKSQAWMPEKGMDN